MWWILVVAAWAGDVIVQSDQQISVEVDGEQVRYISRIQTATATDVAPGKRWVEVRERGERSSARIQVDVPRKGQVFLHYGDGKLQQVHMPTDPRRRGPKRGDTGDPPELVVDVGSVLISGLRPTSSRVWIGGEPTEFHHDAEGFLIQAVPPGKVSVRVEEHGRLRFDDVVDVRAGWTHRCIPHSQGRSWTLDCHWQKGLIDLAAPPPVTRRPERPQRPARPAPPPEPEVPLPMDAATHQALVQSVKNASFSSDQLDILRTAAAHHHLTIAQLGALMDLLSYSSDKVDAVKILRLNVVDPSNAHLLGNHLTYSSDKAQVQQLFQ